MSQLAEQLISSIIEQAPRGEIVKILKKHGADYDDRGGSILFDPPRGPAKSELMKALKKAGADPFRRFRTGRYTVNIG